MLFWGSIGIRWEKAMATHSSTLAWKIPWTEEPGRLQSVGSLRVGHDWATSLLLFPFMHWRRKWQPTPVFLPGESPGWGSLVGCHLWSRTESDTTEVTAAAAAGIRWLKRSRTHGLSQSYYQNSVFECYHGFLKMKLSWESWRFSWLKRQENVLNDSW